MSPLATRLYNFLRWFFDCSPVPRQSPQGVAGKETS